MLEKQLYRNNLVGLALHSQKKYSLKLIKNLYIYNIAIATKNTHKKVSDSVSHLLKTFQIAFKR